MKAFVSQFVKYTVVGLATTGLDLALLYFLVEEIKLHYLLAATVALSLAFLANFTANKYWTFRQREGRYLVQLGRHGVVRAVGWGINLGTLTFLVEIFGFWYFWAKIVATLIAWIWNFMSARKWVFPNGCKSG